MTDRLLALFAYACLAGFVGILVSFVREPDLIIVVVIVMVMALVDFVRLNRPSN